MGALFIRVAVVYVVIGVLFGMAMGVMEKFQYADVHAHINLLGWATLALAGLIYTAYPRAGNTKLAVWHFWLQNIGLPIFIVGLFLFNSIGRTAIPIISSGAIIAILGIIVFAINVLTNVRPLEARSL